MARPLDHWVCIPDHDLQFILDGPEDGDESEWVAVVIEIIEDGLETA